MREAMAHRPIGLLFSDVMERRGIKQAKLEELSGVPRGTLHFVLKGKTLLPDMDTAWAISRALDLPWSYVLAEMGYPPEMDVLLEQGLPLLRKYYSLSPDQRDLIDSMMDRM
jgi:transcriptional regulator with XRE-family HTH domain